MNISFAICTHNEGEYIRTLLDSLKYVVANDALDNEIVILDDSSTDALTLDILSEYQLLFDTRMRVATHPLDDDYAAHKNYLNSLCRGEWILNLDADEFMPQDFLMNLNAICDKNKTAQALGLPRINTVDGLTAEHVRKWNWTLSKIESPEFLVIDGEPSMQEYDLLQTQNMIVSETAGKVTYYKPIICWPDYQMRLYQNLPGIKWQNKVHERLSGFTLFGSFPMQEQFAIRHFKQIARQEEQNEFYDKLMR